MNNLITAKETCKAKDQRILKNGDGTPLLQLKLYTIGSVNAVQFSIILDNKKSVLLYNYELDDNKRGALYEFNEFVKMITIKTIGDYNFLYIYNQSSITIVKRKNKIISFQLNNSGGGPILKFVQVNSMEFDDKIILSQHYLCDDDETLFIYNYATPVISKHNGINIKFEDIDQYRYNIIESPYNGPVLMTELIVRGDDIIFTLIPIVDCINTSINAIPFKASVHMYLSYNVIKYDNTRDIDKVWRDINKLISYKILPDTVMGYVDGECAFIMDIANDETIITSYFDDIDKYKIYIDPFYIDNSVEVCHECISKEYNTSSTIYTLAYATPLNILNYIEEK